MKHRPDLFEEEGRYDTVVVVLSIPPCGEESEDMKYHSACCVPPLEQEMKRSEDFLADKVGLLSLVLNDHSRPMCFIQ